MAIFVPGNRSVGNNIASIETSGLSDFKHWPMLKSSNRAYDAGLTAGVAVHGASLRPMITPKFVDCFSAGGTEDVIARATQNSQAPSRLLVAALSSPSARVTRSHIELEPQNSKLDFP